MKNLIFLFAVLTPWPALSQVLATVGNAKITVEDFSKRYEDVSKQALNPPTAEQFLEDLVRFELAVQEAEKNKMQDDPTVKERFKQVLYTHFLEKQLSGKIGDIKITEKDLKEHYKKYPELRIAHIVSADRKKAQEVFDDVRKSKKPLEDIGGNDLGFQSKLTLPPALYDAALGMRAGEIKGPVETKYGFHVLKLLEKRDYDMADKHQIRAAVQEERRDKIFEDYFTKTKKNYKIEINKEALKSVTK